MNQQQFISIGSFLKHGRHFFQWEVMMYYMDIIMQLVHSKALIKQRWGQIGGAAPGHYCPHQNRQNPPLPQHALSPK